MLPYKKGRAGAIFKEVRCYKGVPEEYKDKKMIKSSGKRKGLSLEKISHLLKYKTIR